MDAQAADDEVGGEVQTQPPAAEGMEPGGGAVAGGLTAVEQEEAADRDGTPVPAVEPDVVSGGSTPSPVRTPAHSAATVASEELPTASADEDMVVGERDQPPAKRAAVAPDQTMSDAEQSRTESRAEPTPTI